jgi:hypothetical protein
LADADQTDDTSGQTPLPLWITVGDDKLAHASPAPEEDTYIGAYQSDDALERAVTGHALADYLPDVIAEVRLGASSTEATSPHEEADQSVDTSGQTPLPLWVAIADEPLPSASPGPEEGTYIGEYPSDEALKSAVAEHDLAAYVPAVIEEVRRGASPPTESPPPNEDGATDAS